MLNGKGIKYLTMTVDEVCQVEIEFAHGDVDMVRIDAEPGLRTFRILLQSFTVCALQRYRFEQDHHYEIQAPHLVGLPQAVYSPHLALLVRIRKHAHRRPFTGDAQHKILAAFLRDVLSQLAQESRCPFLFHLGLLVLHTMPKLINNTMHPHGQPHTCNASLHCLSSSSDIRFSCFL